MFERGQNVDCLAGKEISIRNSFLPTEPSRIVSFSTQGKLGLIPQKQRKQEVLELGVDFVKQSRFLFVQIHLRLDWLLKVDQLELFVQSEQLPLGLLGYPKPF
jgi:hypothetical protein